MRSGGALSARAGHAWLGTGMNGESSFHGCSFGSAFEARPDRFDVRAHPAGLRLGRGSWTPILAAFFFGDSSGAA